MKNLYIPNWGLFKTLIVVITLFVSLTSIYGQAPTAPTRLTVTNIEETTVDLIWNASTDDMAVTGYEVVELGVVDSLLPQADAFVRGGNFANDNYGQEDVLTVKKEANQSFSRRTYIKFNVSSISTTFDKAILRLVSVNAGIDQHDLRVVASNSWTENGIKWNNQPSTVPGILTSWTTPGVGFIDIDLTDLVRSELAADKLFSIQIRSQGPRFISYGSRESSDPSLRPRLIFLEETSTLGTTTGDTTLTVSNLTSGQTYDVAVKALDADSNESELSNNLIFTTAVPVESPTAPLNLVADTITETTADLRWNASTDNVAVTGYEVVELGEISSLLPQADAFVRGGNSANDNYGQEGLLTVKKDANQSFTRRAYMKFDISAIPVSFEKAVLRLVSVNAGIDQHDMRLVTSNSWTENGIKWNNQPSTNSEVIASWTTPGVGSIDIDLTELVRAELAADKLFSIQIRSQGNRFISYGSKEASDSTIRPSLVFLEASSILGTNSGDTTITVSNLMSGQSYDVAVRALDGDGNKSQLSNTLTFITVPDELPGPLFEAEGLVDESSEFPKIFNNGAASGGKVVSNNFTTTFVDLPSIYGFEDGAFLLGIRYRSDADLRKTLIVNGAKTIITLPNSNNQFAGYQELIQLNTNVFNSIRLLTDWDDDQGGDYDYFELKLAAGETPSNPTEDDELDLFGWDFASNYQGVEFYEYSLDRGTNWQDVVANPQPVGDSVYAVGQIQVRVKADPSSNRLAGIPLLSDKAYSINITPLPPVPGTTLWRLGNDDQTANEFPAEYGTTEIDSLTVPTDWETRSDWSIVPKGLKLDQNGTLVLNYELTEIPEHGVELSFRVLDAHRVIPQLDVFSNEMLMGLIQIAGLEGSNVDLKFKETYRLYIPKEFLQEGANSLRLSLDNGLFATDKGDRFHRFIWDYIELKALGAPANEPIHGRYITLGNDFRAGDRYVAARTSFLLSKWIGIAYSGNWMRVGVTIEQSSLTESRRAYLETLKQLNFNAMPLLFTTNFINNEAASGTVSTKGQKQFQDYLSNYADLLTAVEISNEPGLFNTPQIGNVALTQLTLDERPVYAPHLKIVAPGWAYWPTNGTPNGWARDPVQRRPIELLCDYTNGHSYTTSGTQGIGGSLAETMRVYDDYDGDGFPKRMIMSETGGNDDAADNDAYGTAENRFAAVFDREMRGNIGYVDDIMYHADYSPSRFALLDYSNDLAKFNPLDAVAHPNRNEPQNPRLKTYRRLALAYATHGAPLTYDYVNKEELEGKKAYFRAVNTETLSKLSTGAQSDKVLINFTNFDRVNITMKVRVTMPEGMQYVGDRFGAGNAYRTAHSRVALSPDEENNLVFTETIGPGESVQYILNIKESEPPSTPLELIATTKSFNRIDIDWKPSSDNTGVSGYNIYRDDEFINVVPSSVTFFTDKNIVEDTEYTYTVEAFDDSGNLSAMSDPAVSTSDTMLITPGGPKYEAEDCIPEGASFPQVRNQSGASGGKVVWNNFFTTKCKIFGVVAEQEDYVITFRYLSPNDAARDLRINEELNIDKFNISISLPKTGSTFQEAKQQIKLVPGEKNIITILTRFGQDQGVQYDFFTVEPGILEDPVAEWRTVNDDNSAILYSSGFQQNGDLHETNSIGESVTFTFKGTGIRWYSNVVSSYGSAAIFIDDVPVDTVDIPAAAFEGPDKLVYELTGLEDEIHTIKIVSLEAETITVTKLEYLGTGDILVLPGPDVIVQDIKFLPTNAKGGDLVNFIAEVKNIGSLPTPTNVITGVAFSVNGGRVGFSDNFNAVIQPGETVDITQISAPWLAPEDEVVEISAFVDDINRYGQAGTNEQSRSNNTFRKDVFFSSPEATLEAEDAILSGVSIDNSTSGFSGSGYSLFGIGAGFVEWQFNAEDSANYNIGFRYNYPAASATSLELQVNGIIVDSNFTFNVTDESEWTIADINLLLNKGSNTVKLTANTSSNLKLDFLRLSPAVSDEIVITDPVTSSTFDEGSDIPIKVSVSSPDVNKVLLFVNENVLDESQNTPYDFTFQNASAGTYVLTAKGVTPSGLVIQSEAIPIMVAAGSPDLIITNILLNPEYPVTNEDVRFTAVVTNQGVGESPENTIMSVKFKINGQLVAWSNEFFESLLPGESVEIEAASGALGNAFWQTATSGIFEVEAIVDEEERIVESEANNNTFSKQIEVFDALPNVVNLNLTSMCSQYPSIDRRWRVRNPNSFQVAVTWEVVGTSQTGMITVPSGDSFFITATVGGPNTTKILWNNEKGTTKQVVKASGGAQCNLGVPTEPANLIVQIIPNDPPTTIDILLTWDDLAVNEEVYEIERKIGDGLYELLATVRENSTSYTDEGLAAGNAYQYRMRAFNSSLGHSQYVNFTSGSNARIANGILKTEIKKMDVTIYPNPAKDILNLQFNTSDLQIQSIYFTDITGKAYKANYKISKGNLMVIPLNKLNVGLYVFHAIINGTQITEKIIVNK